jgi:UPF0755 protein
MIVVRSIKILIAVFFASALFFSSCVWFVWYSGGISWQKTSLVVHKGWGLSDVSRSISNSNTSYPKWLVKSVVHFMGKSVSLHYGEYRLYDGLSIADLVYNIEHKQGLVMHKVAFIEGRTFSDIKKTLSSNPYLSHNFINKSNNELLASLKITKENPEGMFFPDTYKFAWGSDSFDILQQSHLKMQKILQQEWQSRDDGLMYSDSYQALIVASLIEAETSVDAERTLIAGVILHRLNKGMRLQIDPTVAYGLNQRLSSSLKYSDLKKDTPYNTYVIHGLPPTPINMPGLSSIHAAMHPVFKGYLFYVATGSGGHNFSETFDDHKKEVSKYRAKKHKIESTKIKETLLEAKIEKILNVMLDTMSSRLYVHLWQKVGYL